MTAMTRRYRQLLAATTAAAALALSGCAVPGQDGSPGLAAEWGADQVTTARLDSVYQAWVDDTEARDVANRRQVLTVELMRPRLLAAMADAGVPLPPQTQFDLAEQWLRFQGLGTEPSQEMVDQVGAIYAITYFAYTEPDFATLTALAEDAEANSVVSPRSGDFSAEVFLESVAVARRSADNQDLQQFSYTEFQHVNGLVDASVSWVVVGFVK